MAGGSKRLFFFHTNADYLTGFRLPMLVALRDAGYRITAFAPDMTQEHMGRLAMDGIEGRSYALDAAGMNPVSDAVNLFRIAALLRRDPPDLLFLNNAKPVIYGAIAAKIAGIKRTVAMVGGLGYAFIDGKATSGISKKVARCAASVLYWVSLRLVHAVIFHNRDDLTLLVGRGICPSNSAKVIPGSGVDLERYRPQMELPNSPQVFVFVGRLLAEKGIREFLDASKVVKGKYPESRFIVVGGVVPNPSSMAEAEIQHFANEGVVEWVGHVSDVRPYLHSSTVFVLPSYREGLPRSALEAMACGLPVITTDVPGCRNVVEDDLNGILVPAQSSAAVAVAMERFCESEGLARKMGAEGRKRAERDYSIQTVNRLVIDIIDRI